LIAEIKKKIESIEIIIDNHAKNNFDNIPEEEPDQTLEVPKS
jgi:hypothetical protein